MTRIILALAAALSTAASLQVQQNGRVGGAEARAAALPNIAEMVSEVDQDKLIASVAALESFGTRYASTAACEAAGTEIGDWFRMFGLPTEFEYFQFGTSPHVNTTSNFIATLPGRVDPSRIIIVSAHYDSFSNEAQTRAPGADDNASGVAVVVELARILRNYRFDFTVKFIAWGAEERGLVGSRYHAQAAQQRQDRIIATIVADMVGYVDAAPEDLDIVSDPRSQWLADRYAAAATAYGGLASARRTQSQFSSDCMAFWEKHYTSACAIEDFNSSNPYFHKATDIVSTLNPDFLAATARATLALVAELAQPISMPAPPTALQVVTQTSTSRFRRARSALLTWEASDGAVAGYNIYRATSSHGEYRRLTTSAVTGTAYIDYVLDPSNTYYYVVTAIDQSGRESNYSGETSDEVTR